jgi:2'-5' RNA ligase
MSLFVAVRPSDAAVEDLQDALVAVRRQPVARDLRWQPPGQWHITLAFLGEDSPDLEAEVCDRLAALEVMSPVPGLSISGAGCFGRQVLWMDVHGDDAVTALGEVCTAIPPLLRGSGAQLDRRPWRPHLTIARARHTDARPVVPLLSTYIGPQWDADEVLVVRSTGGPHPDHHIAMRIPLTGTGKPSMLAP